MYDYGPKTFGSGLSGITNGLSHWKPNFLNHCAKKKMQNLATVEAKR